MLCPLCGKEVKMIVVSETTRKVYFIEATDIWDDTLEVRHLVQLPCCGAEMSLMSPMKAQSLLRGDSLVVLGEKLKPKRINNDDFFIVKWEESVYIAHVWSRLTIKDKKGKEHLLVYLRKLEDWWGEHAEFYEFSKLTADRFLRGLKAEAQELSKEDFKVK